MRNFLKRICQFRLRVDYELEGKVLADKALSEQAPTGEAPAGVALTCDAFMLQVDNGTKCTTRLARLFNNSKFSDVVLRVGDECFYAHKLLLANCSDVFE